MANIKDFIKKIGNETVSLEEQQRALAAVEQTIVEAKAKREESIGKNVDLVISALKKIESDLNTKLVELNNTPAKQGVAGPQGEKGRDGRDGVDGYKGQDGKDGVDGQDGKDGEDGISVVDAKVDFDGSLVITLSDGREIDAGTIVPLDVAKNIHSVQTAGTGSTSQAVLDAIAAIQATLATYGTMATQNANAVAITGGTVNNTTIGATTASTGAFTTLTSTGGAVNGTIGATTPAVGTFTTITGQTEVLKGTGQNLYVYSEQFDNAQYDKFSVTVTANSTTAPDGTTTADTLTGNGVSNTHRIDQTTRNSSPAGTPKVISVYAKANTNNFIQLYFNGDTVPFANFDLSAGTVGTVGSTTTASIVSAGSGWYRCIAITTSTTASNPGVCLIASSTDARVPTNSLSTSVYLWGIQVEVGNTVGTYVQTVATAVYGTPTLSFSGVAGLGLQSDGSLYVSPAGTGALQAQATTSTATGGNARGANAVDLQTSRSSATAVASGQYSFIGGGNANSATSFGTISMGLGNGASGFGAATLSGNNNSNSSTYSVITGGQNNVCSSYLGFVGSGLSNTAAGYYNFIGAGFTNSGTSGSAVTTQSGTMNATTAVTLSGSNANIKVGQYITGTSIAAETYVAAISGTALTLSKVASGSSTSTLSFYTPHGVVVGGGNNQATGSYSFIGGGGDAGTAANRNVASGDWSVVVGGHKNTASGQSAFVGAGGDLTAGSIFGNTASGVVSGVVTGANNIASGYGSFIGGGASNASSATYSGVAFGNTNASNSDYSSILGGTQGTTRSIIGFNAQPYCNSPISGSAGVSQGGMLILGVQTTDATATALRSNTSAASGTNQVILPNNSAYYFKIEVIAGKTGAGDTKAWELKGAIKRGANAASTAIVGSVTTTVIAADAGASTWTLTATADTTNGGITVTATGQAATTIRWVARCTTSEMTY